MNQREICKGQREREREREWCFSLILVLIFEQDLAVKSHNVDHSQIKCLRTEDADITVIIKAQLHWLPRSSSV